MLSHMRRFLIILLLVIAYWYFKIIYRYFTALGLTFPFCGKLFSRKILRIFILKTKIDFQTR